MAGNAKQKVHLIAAIPCAWPVTCCNQAFTVTTARILRPSYRVAADSSTRLVLPTVCLRCGLLFVVSLPSLVNDVGMNRIRILFCHLQIRESKFWRIGKAGHSLVPVRAGQDDAVPVAMDIRRRVAQIGNRAVEHPGAAAISVRRVTTITNEFSVKQRTLVNCFRAGGLLRRFWDRRHDVRRHRERHSGAKFESQQAHGPAF